MTDPTADTALRERMTGSFERQGFMRHLGARLDLVEPGEVRILLPHHLGLTRQHGFFHAGATSAIADSAGGYAGLTLLPPPRRS